MTIIKTEQIIGTTLVTLQELYSSRVHKRAGKIIVDPSHPAHFLFKLLPSDQYYRALCTKTAKQLPQEQLNVPPLCNKTCALPTYIGSILLYVYDQLSTSSWKFTSLA